MLGFKKYYTLLFLLVKSGVTEFLLDKLDLTDEKLQSRDAA